MDYDEHRHRPVVGETQTKVTHQVFLPIHGDGRGRRSLNAPRTTIEEARADLRCLDPSYHAVAWIESIETTTRVLAVEGA